MPHTSQGIHVMAKVGGEMIFLSTMTFLLQEPAIIEWPKQPAPTCSGVQCIEETR